MSLAQLKNTGDLEATEFSEISYAGKGDGSSVYIDTGIPANTINNFEIVFKYNAVTSNKDIFGVYEYYSVGIRYFMLRQGNAGVFRLYIGYSTFYWNLSTYVIENNNYRLNIVNNGLNSFTIVLYNLTLNTQVYTNTNNITGLVPSINTYIYGRNLDGAFDDKSVSTIYSFTINSETWYINNGTGNTITGSLGTVLTVNGTITNFWQQSDIWNEDANLKMYNTGLVKCNEFIEDGTITEQMKLYSDSVKVKNQFIEV